MARVELQRHRGEKRKLPKLCTVHSVLLIPVVARTKVCVCGRSLTEVAGLNTSGGMEVTLL